jgi:hypothetical protein
MLWLFIMLFCVGVWMLPYTVTAEPRVGANLRGMPSAESQAEGNPPPEASVAPQLPFIAGRPYEEALEIFKQHRGELLKLPGVSAVTLDAEGILIITDNPAALPQQVKGIPVKSVPITGPPIAGIPYEKAWAIFNRHREKLMQIPGVESVQPGPTGILVRADKSVVLPLEVEGLPVKRLPASGSQQLSSRPEQQCPSDTHWNTEWGRCVRNTPLAVPAQKLLPPSPGVMVLRPGGVREQADTCPEGFKEVVVQDWRFCIDPKQPEPIPPLWEPPIAGISFEEALKILERHREELMRLPGVESVGMGTDGIHIHTDDPSVLPTDVEGVPIKPMPPLGPLQGANHTLSTPIRPLHGGLAVGENLLLPVPLTGTLTGIALSQERPWLIFPTHLLQGCEFPSPCPPSSTSSLNNCSPYAGSTRILQPPASTLFTGFVQRWDPLTPMTNSTDVAAAFMDGDTIQGNGSLHGDRKLEQLGISFTGATVPPALNSTVTVVSMVTPHAFSAQVTAINQTTPPVGFNCRDDGLKVPLQNQTFLQAITPCFTSGDSGSIVLDQNGNVVGMFNWFNLANQCVGGGTNSAAIRTKLGFDNWYGNQISGFALKCN